MDVVDPIEVALAQEAVDAFCRQFGTPGSRPYQAYRDFARHAALPLTFTADLLYRLQDRFRQDMRGNALHIPWVAVADLMLSHLCHEVRPETFRLDEQVQALLLAELQADRARFWTADGRSSRLQEVAAFLIHYAAHQMNHPSHYVREAAKAERLNAQVIINPEWVRRSLQETAVTLQPQQDPVATLRLASLVHRFNHAVNLTRPEADTTRQDFNKLQAYTAGQAQLAAGKAVTAVAQQFRTTFGSDSNIQIGGQTLPGLGQLVGEPAQPTLPASLSIAFAGYDLTRVLQKGAPLPATSERITLRHEDTKLDQGFGYPAIQILQGESTSVQENYQLGDITLTDESLYIYNELEIEVMLTVTPEGAVHIQLSHHSGYSSELTMFLVDAENLGEPSIIELGALVERFTQGVKEDFHLTALTAVSNWLNSTEAARTLIIRGERNAGKTTIAALLAQYFRGDRQPPNDLYALTPTSTSAIYFCQPSRPETLHPRSFALTIASQWVNRDSGSRDSPFVYTQSVIDNHEKYELDTLIDELLIKPFNDIFEHIYPGSIVFLVDDLEAALQHPGETTIVDVILRMLREVPGMRFLLTTQMQPAVRSKLADVEAEFIHLGDRYDNFDIHVGQPLPGPQQRYPIVVTSETSGQLQDIEQTFAPVTELGYERLARLRDLASSPEETIEIGQRLFSVLMREPNYEMVRRSLEATRSRGKAGLRLRLRFDDPSLQAYPWELCHDGRSFIFNNPDQPILLQRTVGVENYQAPPPLPRPVRLLVAIAAPADQSPADVDLPGKMIRLATEEVVTRSELDVQIIRHATLRELESVVQAYQPHIVQFIGHSRGEKDGVLILENESGRSNLVPVPELTRLLTAAPVQCVILSPIGVGENSLTQLAPQFIQQGIPTVLAEQFPLPDQPATAFWRTFYNTLLFDRLSFEDGVWNGRNRLATTHSEPFWGLAVSFSGQALHSIDHATKEQVDKDIPEKKALNEPLRYLNPNHQMRILLVEDDVNTYDPTIRWLKEEGYEVRLATSYAEAKSALETEHFHLLITGLRLDADPDNEEGLQLLDDVEQMQLRGIMPTIVCTAYQALALKAWDLRADGLILKEAGYLRKLISIIKGLEEEKIRINFDLEYVSNSLNVLEEVVEDIYWGDLEQPSIQLLASQTRDLFSKLFVDARSLYISKLKPELTGASTVRVTPTWTEGIGRTYVAKVGRRDKVETEQDHYKANSEGFRTGSGVVQADVRYSRHLGVLLYNFAESQGGTLIEFDEFYVRSEPNQIIASLKEMFDQTYRYWFDNPERVLADVASLYYEAFQLDRKKLIGRLQIVLPTFDPDAEQITLIPEKESFLNPIAWLDKYQTERVIQVHKCITHGNLTGRNIMVDETGKFWLMDFYRNYKSHNLRDFVILETDIKYRLMPKLSLAEFLELEKLLIDASSKSQPQTMPASFSENSRKAAEVILALRQLALKYTASFNTQTDQSSKEILLSLLMATLNVVRLRHIPEARKFQAIASASLICEELDKLAGRKVNKSILDLYRADALEENIDDFYPNTGTILASFVHPQVAKTLATAQQRFLAENVEGGNTVLFVGSAIPRNSNWPNNQELALQLMKEIDISASTSDKPTKLFAFYVNRVKSRNRLIQMVRNYYSPEKLPSFYSNVVKLPWIEVYTTNQHTYLEQAFQNIQVPFKIRIEAGTESSIQETITIYKLYGSLSSSEQDPDKLPITEYDHRQAQNIQRVQDLWKQVATTVKQGNFLLMLCPTEDELMSAYQYCQPTTTNGLVWLTGGDISEEEQDIYRNLDFRVLPDQPEQLLQVLFNLVNDEDQNTANLPKYPSAE